MSGTAVGNLSSEAMVRKTLLNEAFRYERMWVLNLNPRALRRHRYYLGHCRPWEEQLQ